MVAIPLKNRVNFEEKGESRRTQVVPTVGESLNESRPVSNVMPLPAVLSWFEFSATPALL